MTSTSEDDGSLRSASRDLTRTFDALLFQRWRGYAVAVLAVVGVSLFIGLVLGRFRVANLSMLYLIAVLVAAVWGGRGPAVVTSILAFLAFNWFFVQPLHTFTVADSGEWVALLLFLLTAVVTGQLAAALRQGAKEAMLRRREAEQREREAVVLYDVARLFADPELDRALQGVAERLRRELGLTAVGIELSSDAGRPFRAVAGEDVDALDSIRSHGNQPARILGEGPTPSEGRRGKPGRWVRLVPTRAPGAAVPQGDRVLVVPIKLDHRQAGTLVLVREQAGALSAGGDRLLSAVAAQVGSALDRARLRQDATEAEILRRTDELKTALLNAVSHDLRTPLASIIASAGSLRQDDVVWSPDEQREFLQAIVDEAQRLNRLVGNLLDLSRVEGGSLRPEKGWYDLAALVDDVLGRLRPVTARHQVSVDIPDDVPPILLDYVEVDQVLSNLIENAAKYTSPGTRIEVSARVVPGAVRVAVEDRGPGIPSDALPRVFDRFFRAEGVGDRRSSGISGTGLGLAVVKGLIDAHGGRIWAENRAGGGARFIFTLPVTPGTEALMPGEVEG